MLLKLHQHVKCATRGVNTLDKVYTNIRLGYRARPAPHLRKSDHIFLQLIPAYNPLRKSTPCTTQSVRTWPDGATQQLTETKLRTRTWIYLQALYCVTVIVERRIRVYPNQKPWMTREVKQLLKERNAAFKIGDRALHSTACAKLKRH